MLSSNLSATSVETTSMALLADLQIELNAAINSLGGKQQHHVEDKYYFFAAAHINRALHGFLLLRGEGWVDAAKLLIRPALEAMIRVQAVRNQPHLVYRIMYTETLEDDKWHGRAAKRQGLTYDHSRNSSAWIEFTESCKAQFGADKIIDQELSLSQRPKSSAVTPTTTPTIACTADIRMAGCGPRPVQWTNLLIPKIVGRWFFVLSMRSTPLLPLEPSRLILNR
jgi:hypothetical protein